MRKRIATSILTAALAGIAGLTPTGYAQNARDANAPAGNKAADPQQAQLPVRQVVLYSSGVGYFEHFGTVKGTGATELRFKTQQINDILKSLVLQDMDKGRVGVITYPSQDPVAKTLRSFQVDITNNPSLADLLNQLRGARVSLSAGTEKVAGTVLGVEKKPRPVGGDAGGGGNGGAGGKLVEVAFLNLVTDAGIRSVPLDDVRTFELQDAQLRDELARALAALAAARDQDKKPVSIGFQGDGERRLRVGYVVETPVWKTSYRLVLADKPDAPAAGAADPKAAPNLGGGGGGGGSGGAGGAGPATRPGGGGGPGGAGVGSLQGWAIVENQTDNDWADVQLSLVSGRPISFIQDLYQPLYVPRPVVQPELYASLRPQTYDAGMAAERELTPFNRPGGAVSGPAPAPAASAAPADRFAARGARAEPARAGSGSAGQRESTASDTLLKENLASLDAAASVSSVASAAKVGELFQYTVGNVSLPRQTSAMIPVVTDPVEVEKVSIYNLAVLPKNPLLGARVKNTTGKHLLQGPVTVLDGGSYAGDARVDDVPPGQERLISYGVDQQVIVQAKNSQQQNAVQTGKVVKGVLLLTRKLVNTQEYAAENKGDKGKTLVIEHAKLGGDWRLVEPAKADETTDALYRFKGRVEAGKGTKLTVRQELIATERIDVLPMDVGTLLAYARTGEIPQPVRDALAKAAGFQQDLAATERQVQERQKQANEITQEQTRIRENMRTVAQNTDYYTRLLTKLGEQENRIETLQKEVADLQKKAADQRNALAEYVNGLSVG